MKRLSAFSWHHSVSLSFFFFKQKTAYEMRISDWSSDVCSSDLLAGSTPAVADGRRGAVQRRHRDRDDVQQAAAQGRPAIDAHGREADVREGRPRHAGADRTPLPRSARGGMILEAQIGRASCRERVCQYV